MKDSKTVALVPNVYAHFSSYAHQAEIGYKLIQDHGFHAGFFKLNSV
jgi:hypothetical protein